MVSTRILRYRTEKREEKKEQIFKDNDNDDDNDTWFDTPMGSVILRALS